MTGQAALVEEATRRSGVVWVAAEGAPPRAAWHLWHDGAVWLLVAATGDSAEQRLPGLPGADRARLTVRSKEKRSRLVVYDATVERVPPDSSAWDDLLPLLVASRLNAPGGPTGAPRRWRQEAALLRLTPLLPPVESPWLTGVE